ncbi:Uncharacterised protein [Mycobacteroides abscessus subsp. massiliense]|nr:Uncharacterised protein [Mycobacteroides abscessus subsp. massiliense]SKH51488.1 Uncharacterised protein [Mycobacteroides abscessus subsp. massiliense]SKI05572.1 Uncharacterised protein [Mycobacteroides abscessus subsp. massiliense]SKJ90030.1 Uncharacterised protein [Mycobacteroides abscessus subsp. massiliense]
MSTTLPNVRVYEPGRDITAEVAGSPVTIKRFVKIAGNRTGAGTSPSPPPAPGSGHSVWPPPTPLSGSWCAWRVAGS